MKSSHIKGFTLIEMIIVVAMIAILAAVAYPSYKDSVRKSNRAEATTFLLDAASRQEKYFAKTFGYARNMKDLGFTTNTINTPHGLYTISISSATPALPAKAKEFTLKATAIGDQAKDACGNFLIDNFAVKTVSPSSKPANCW